MTPPTVREFGEKPPGVLPRNLQVVLLGAAALIVVVASIFSGSKKSAPQKDVAPMGSTVSQLTMFQAQLEQRRRDAEEAQKHLDEARLAAAQAGQANSNLTPAALSPAPPDRLAQIRREREANAPFASNYTVQADSSVVTAKVDRASQVVVLAEEKREIAKPSSPKAEEAQPRVKESGHALPAQEGDLFRLYEGTLIAATLTNRLEGSFTGPVNCVVVRDVMAENQAAVLIPKGSRLLGKASRVEAENQTRLAVTFSRLIMPSGYSVNLEAAPGLDGTGTTGLKDKVQNHNLRKFGIAGAVGLLGGLALYAGQGAPYASGVANSMGSSATSILSHYLNVVPTITIREGHTVEVYLPNDLLLPAYRP